MKNTITIIAAAALGLAIQGCAPSAYKVTEPAASNISFAEKKIASPINLVDKRSQVVFSHGVLPADLMLKGKKIEPVLFLKEHTEKELKARGVDFDVNNVNQTKININKLEMRNHRTNGYTPFITLTMLSADVETKDGTKRVGAFIKRGKVPVWSFDEIVQPTLNEPLSLLVKEFSAKLNAHLYDGKMSDAEVRTLVDKIASNSDKKYSKVKYLDVYQLGFSNNKKAIPEVYKLSKSDEEYTRMAAISSLGTLGAVEYFDELKDIAQNAKTWTDKAMAMKAIGDLDTDESRAFLTKMREQLKSANSKEQYWSSEIIGLYL